MARGQHRDQRHDGDVYGRTERHRLSPNTTEATPATAPEGPAAVMAGTIKTVALVY